MRMMNELLMLPTASIKGSTKGGMKGTIGGRRRVCNLCALASGDLLTCSAAVPDAPLT